MMTERNVNDDYSIEIREEEESAIDPSNQNVRGMGNQEDRVNTVSSNIDAKLVSKAPSLTTTSIYKIPDRIKKHHEEDFVPRLISIGPFHHGKKNLQAMEAVKLWYLHDLLLRKTIDRQTYLKQITEEVTRVEEYCRDCYDENLNLSSEAFAEMMVVDGCFIIEFYRKMAQELPQHKDDVLGLESRHLTWTVAASDTLLLENQLPWRVVECLFELTKELDIHNQVPDRKSKSLWELCCKVWEKNPAKLHSRHTQSSESRHLLDAYRLLSVEPDYIGDTPEVLPLWVSLPSATELVQIGVEFKSRQSDDKVFTITFVDGVMEISLIPILQNRLIVLRNLVALEGCEPRGPHTYQITFYCRIMNDLIKSTKDVEILMAKGNLSKHISKEEMVGFFHDICNSTVTTSSSSRSFFKISESVRDYYKRRWLKRWIASIKRDYLYNPSSIWSISNAVVLVIILTAIQTIYSVLSYYKS